MIYVIICVVAALAVIAFAVGLVKGYTKTKTWATEYICAAFITVLVYNMVDVESTMLHACLTVGTAIVLLLLFAFLSDRIKRFIRKATADARLRNYYETYGEREAHVMEIVDAIELNDKKAYKRLTQRPMKEKSGPAGVGDCIAGGLTLALKSLVVMAVVAVSVLLVLQFTQLSFVVEGGALYSVYSSNLWQSISPYIFDFMLIGILQFAIRAGYRSGILRSLWVLAVLALVVGAGYVSYYLAFRVEAFTSFASNIAAMSLIASAGNAVSAVIASITAQTIAQAILLVALFIVMLIFILIISKVVSGIIERVRQEKLVGIADGAIGALIFTVIVLAIVLFVGMLLYSFNDVAFMDIFNSYCYTTGEDGSVWPSAVFSSIYSRNPLNEIQVFADIQTGIRNFFGIG